MAVLYRLTKNNNQYNSSYGKWYAQSVMTETVDTSKPKTDNGGQNGNGNGSGTGE